MLVCTILKFTSTEVARRFSAVKRVKRFPTSTVNACDRAVRYWRHAYAYVRPCSRAGRHAYGPLHRGRAHAYEHGHEHGHGYADGNAPYRRAGAHANVRACVRDHGRAHAGGREP